jgi:hypothetical protein
MTLPNFPFLFLCVAFCSLGTLRAADDPRLAAVTAADDARVSAMTSPNREKLEAVLSADLHYAHSTGAVDTRTSFIEKLVSGATKYLAFEYEERTFTFPSADIALMTGRAKIKAVTPNGSVADTLGYLGVWRNEGGQWHFLAWQSCKLPASDPVGANHASAGTILITGEVRNAGPQELATGETLTQAISKAGGLSPWGNGHKVKLLRQKNGVIDTTIVDFYNLLKSGGVQSDPVLQDGDRIFVPKMASTF